MIPWDTSWVFHMWYFSHMHFSGGHTKLYMHLEFFISFIGYTRLEIQLDSVYKHAFSYWNHFDSFCLYEIYLRHWIRPRQLKIVSLAHTCERARTVYLHTHTHTRWYSMQFILGFKKSINMVSVSYSSLVSRLQHTHTFSCVSFRLSTN